MCLLDDHDQHFRKDGSKQVCPGHNAFSSCIGFRHAEGWRWCRDKIRRVRAWPSNLESRSFAEALAELERVRRPAFNMSAPVDRPHTHLGSDIASSANTGCPPPNTASKVVAAIASLD